MCDRGGTAEKPRLSELQRYMLLLIGAGNRPVPSKTHLFVELYMLLRALGKEELLGEGGARDS